VEGAYEGPRFELDEREILHQVTEGLDYLHQNEIIHLDIKPNNIFISAPEKRTDGTSIEPRMKLAYFGLSTFLKSGQVDTSPKINTNPRGTRGWIAPELYEKGFEYDYKVDIFPLGCVFGYTLSKKNHHPFGEQEEVRASRIKQKEEPLNMALKDLKKPYANECTLELILSMIEMDSKKRPSTESILKHKFFTGNSDGPTLLNGFSISYN